MKIAVIGASGNAGSRITAELARRGHAVTAIARNPEKIARLANVIPTKGDASDEAGLTQLLRGHDVATVQEMAWAGIANGALLRAAADAGFEALLTVDRGIEFQQSLRGLELSVVAIQARSNDINDLRLLMPQVDAALRKLRPGIVVHIPGSR